MRTSKTAKLPLLSSASLIHRNTHTPQSKTAKLAAKRRARKEAKETAAAASAPAGKQAGSTVAATARAAAQVWYHSKRSE